MNESEDSWVEWTQLRNLRRLGDWARDAGNSTLWECDYAGRLWIFKDYSDEFRARADQHALGRLIAWRDELSAADRTYLDSVAAWPRFRVRSGGYGGRLHGVLLPRAPDRFFFSPPDDRKYAPRNIAYLVRYRLSDGRIWPGADATVKRRALGNAALVLRWFHRQQVLVNDVRETNILCALDGSSVYYVDCDVAFGPWGAVGPAAAPEYLAEVLPQTATPKPEVDLARLAWLAIFILQDSFSLATIPVAQLTRQLTGREADLIIRTAELSPINFEEWTRLGDRWTRWSAAATVPPRPTTSPDADDDPTVLHPSTRRATGRVPIGQPAAAQTATVYTTLPKTKPIEPPPTRPHPSKWLPPQYRWTEPPPPSALTSYITGGARVEPPPTRNLPRILWISAGAIVFLIVLVAISMT